MSTVLVIDDKELMRDSVGATLQRAGFAVVSAADGAGALELIARKRPDVVVTDLRMPGQSGIDVVQAVGRIDDELPVIVMTAHGTIETAVEAMKRGAFDYLTKPFEGDELIIAVKRAIRHAAVLRENNVLRAGSGQAAPGPAGSERPRARRGLDRLIGDSPIMHRLREQIQAVAGSHGSVLVSGPSGAGKEEISRAVHELSPRASGPFLAVNCAALSESLLESELFGHERGAFTGADRMRKGRFELADGGTLLLDEVSEVSPAVQAKLLRVLQERAFERVGSSITIGVDVRVIATSNRDLTESIARGAFRQDLFYRLNVLPLAAPALADRLEDVPLLAEHFFTEICARDGRPPMRLSPEATSLLRAYRWPGNVRELQNVCERAVVLSTSRSGGEIDADLIRPWLTIPAASSAVHVEVKGVEAGRTAAAGVIQAEGRTLEDVERDAILMALRRHGGHRLKTAQSLGIGVRTLGLKLKKWKEQKLVEPEL